MMQITFKRTGGLAAAMRRECTINADSLSSEEVQKLRDMVAAADFFHLTPASTAPVRGADLFQFEVTVEMEGKQHTIQIQQSAVPPTLWPLLKWLTDKACQTEGK